MARNFVASSTDYLDTGVSDALQSGMSVHMWMNPTSWTSGNRIFHSPNNFELSKFSVSGEARFNLYTDGTTGYCYFFSLLTSGWQSILVTQNGTDVPSGYRDGGSDTVSLNWDQAPTGTRNTPTGNWHIGGTAGSTGFGGDIAEVAMWNRILTNAEKLMLADGFSALFIPNGLVYYSDLMRDVVDKVGGKTATIGGTTVSSHPPNIIYPSAQIIEFPSTAAPIEIAIPTGPLR